MIDNKMYEWKIADRPTNDWLTSKLLGVFNNSFFLGRLPFIKRLIRKKFALPKTVTLRRGFYCNAPVLQVAEKVDLSDTFIIAAAPLYIGKYSRFSSRNIVITGGHPLDDFYNKTNGKPVVIEEDVWITTNVTIMQDIIIGRGAVILPGSVCNVSIPPYAMVMGNPAKIVGFKFLPEEIIEYEKALYPENEKLSLELLEKNHKRYFLGRIKEIANYVKL